ncbi:hypothetical protein [Thalassospira alkalitolerans]|uniref:hypothetical protein n=1 Tax=Thalassospira alkalitolerans TaxID=1293890 RepID=UPI003AA94AD8
MAALSPAVIGAGHGMGQGKKAQKNVMAETDAPVSHRLESFDCVDENGDVVQVTAWRYMLETMTERGMRRYPGARYWTLGDGADVRLRDATLFEVASTGMVLIRLQTADDDDA